MILGDLEKQVLQYLWSVPEADAKQAHSTLTKSRGGTLNTIQSTLDRLFKKGLLSREKRGHAYQYRARLGREKLMARLIQDVTCDFLGKGEHSLIAAFSSISAELDDEKLTQLEELIQLQRQLRSQENSDAD